MSTENTPEITSLNAEDMDASQLDDETLEDVAGGGDTVCVGFSCTGYVASDTPVDG